MSTQNTLSRYSGSVLGSAEELIDEYASMHGLTIRVWRRDLSDWVLEYSTDALALPAPQGATRQVDVLSGPEIHVEVVDSDADSAQAGFIGSLVRNAVRQQIESRFFGREIAERYEEITLLYTISEILGSVITLEQAAGTILQEVVDTLGVQRAALWVHDSESGQLELAAAVGMDGQIGPIRADDEGSVTATVFRKRTPMILESGDVFPREQGLPGGNRDSFLSVPIGYTPPRGETRTIGVINLVGRTADESFSAGDQKLITAIASQIGAAIENSRLVADSLRQERLDHEMELAHDLQLKLLPSPDQFREVGDISARCVQADSVGGDFYNFFRLPDGCIGVMIADVSSHGFAAALIMALTMSAVAIHASEGDAPSEVLRRTHRALIDELESTEMYLTLFYAVIDPRGGRISFANAGHSHAFRIAGDGSVERLSATNPPFGIVDLDNYSEESLPWNAGSDLLLLFTDGLSERLSTTDGEERVLQAAIDSRASDLDEVIEKLFALEPQDRSAPSDDRTALLLRV